MTKLDKKKTIIKRKKLLREIKVQRVRLAMTQSQVAEGLNISLTTFSVLENGGQSIGIDKIIEVADLLGLEIVFKIKDDGEN